MCFGKFPWQHLCLLIWFWYWSLSQCCVMKLAGSWTWGNILRYIRGYGRSKTGITEVCMCLNGGFLSERVFLRLSPEVSNWLLFKLSEGLGGVVIARLISSSSEELGDLSSWLCPLSHCCFFVLVLAVWELKELLQWVSQCMGREGSSGGSTLGHLLFFPGHHRLGYLLPSDKLLCEHALPNMQLAYQAQHAMTDSSPECGHLETVLNYALWSLNTLWPCHLDI